MKAKENNEKKVRKREEKLRKIEKRKQENNKINAKSYSALLMRDHRYK